MKRHSLRLRMMLLFCLVVGVLLGCSYLVLYISFERAVQYEGDSRLLSTADPIIADFLIDPSENDVSELTIPNEYFEVLNRQGKVLQWSENLRSGSLPIPINLLSNRGPVFFNMRTEKEGKLRLAILPFQTGQEVRYFAIAAPPREAERDLSTFRTLIFVLFPLGLLITAGVSSWYAGRSLRPITELSQHVVQTIKDLPGQWAADRRTASLSRPADELGVLSANFDELFGRLTAVMTQLQQFVSDASHELRTPLAVLRGETELLLAKTRSRAEYEKALRIIDAELKKLSRIVDGLFTLSMADAGHLRVSREPLYLEEVLEETCALAMPMAEAKQIVVQRDFQHDVAFRGDAAFLRQLFLIFLDNAIKYSPPNSHIDVRLLKVDHSVKVQFQDEGVGIAAEHIPRIFERFFRAPQPHPTDTQSGGLGLAIAQAIVQAHEGRIECESQSGVGTRFTIVMPIPPAVEINKN